MNRRNFLGSVIGLFASGDTLLAKMFHEVKPEPYRILMRMNGLTICSSPAKLSHGFDGSRFFQCERFVAERDLQFDQIVFVNQGGEVLHRRTFDPFNLEAGIEFQQYLTLTSKLESGEQFGHGNWLISLNKSVHYYESVLYRSKHPYTLSGDAIRTEYGENKQPQWKMKFQ